eukprot:g17034.t1
MVLEVVFDEKVKKLGMKNGHPRSLPHCRDIEAFGNTSCETDNRTSVTGVKPGSEAHKHDLRAGDVLATINGVAIGRPTREELKALLKQRPLTLQIERPDGAGAGGSDSGSESEDEKAGPDGSPLAARQNADLALLTAAKAKAASASKARRRVVLAIRATSVEAVTDVPAPSRMAGAETRPLRVKLRSGRGRGVLLLVPRSCELVADLQQHVQMRLEEEKIVLKVQGYALLPTQRVREVLRDGDELVSSTARGPSCTEATPALKDVELVHDDTRLTSWEAAHQAKEILKRARPMPPPASPPATPPAPVLPPWPPVKAKENFTLKKDGEAVAISHPVLGDLEVPSGQAPEDFVNRKLKTLSKAIRKQAKPRAFERYDATQPCNRGGYVSQAASKAAPSAVPKDADSGEDSAEEPQTEQIRPDRFDHDMDLLHQRMKPPTAHAKVLEEQSFRPSEAKDADTAAQEADDEALALQLQEDLLKETEERLHAGFCGFNTQDDAAIARQLQREEGDVSPTAAPQAEPLEATVAASRPRPDLLAAASAVAAAREEERLAGAEGDDDDEESWAEEEVERSSKGPMQIKVRVPEGCRAGDTLEVVSPTGDLVHVVIPDGHGPGSLLMVQVQNRPQNGPQNMLYSSLTEKHTLQELPEPKLRPVALNGGRVT